MCIRDSIHTLFMRFPIDAVFVGRDGTVVGVERDLKPWRMARRRGAKWVLELAAGEADARALSPGARLQENPA